MVEKRRMTLMSHILQVSILCFVEILTYKLFLSCFFNNKNTLPISKWIGLSILTILQTISALYCPIIAIRLIIFALSTTVVFSYMYISKIYFLFFACIVYCGIMSCIETPTYIILTHLLGPERISLIEYDYAMLTIVGLLVKLLILLAIILLSKIFGKAGHLRYIHIQNWLTILCLPLFSMISLYSIIFYDIDYFAVIISFALILLNVLLYNYLQENGLVNKRKLELLALEERNKIQLEAFKDIGGLYDEQRQRIHEFKNQINVIYGLLCDNDYDSIKSYIGQLKDSNDSQLKPIETHHPILNVLINQAIKKASVLNIAITPDISIVSDIIISDNDLVIIVSNLFNNAIEHCSTLEHSNKIISFKLESNSNHLLIACINPIEKPIIIENNLIKSTKGNNDEHGYGLKNILQIVNKYKGDVSIDTNDNKFKYAIYIENGAN